MAMFIFKLGLKLFVKINAIFTVNILYRVYTANAKVFNAFNKIL